MNDIKSTQHFTTNKDVIRNLTDDILPINHLVEPFFGAGDLVADLLNCFDITSVEFYDIDTSHSNDPRLAKRDTLMNPPEYKGKTVITNPPYLAKNKTNDKEIFNKYGVDDWYKASILSILDCEKGILVVPLNFLTDKRSANIRKQFFNNFRIITLNIFLYPVFKETSYQTCAFSFERKAHLTNTIVNIFTNNDTKQFETIFTPEHNYLLLGENYYNLFQKPTYEFHRLLKGDENKSLHKIPIVFNLVDKTSKEFSVEAIYTNDLFYGISTDRTFLSLYTDKEINVNWTEVVKLFNHKLKEYRESTYNLTLTNYRDVGRKRLSFEEVYSLLSLCIHLTKE